ncbi:SDR family oxidoreductase [Bacteriovoracaceae bacterium]|nr:SDR family oxidoreductase [Bacteriovoracaceae bacterium]
MNNYIVVTGGNRGIGWDICKSLCCKGFSVLLGSRKVDQALHEKISAEIDPAYKENIIPFICDLGNLDETKESFKSLCTERSITNISALINNAGISIDHLALRAKENDINLILDTNLTSTIKLTNHLLRFLLKAQDGASVVNMSSVVGLMGNLSQSTYAASKAGIIGYTKSMAKEYAGKNIRFNAICPGFIQTAMTDNLSEKAKQNYLDQIPLKRLGSGEDVANLVHFLISKQSSYITGETIKVDGGLYI